MTPSAEIEPGPHWWKASALTTRPTLPPEIIINDDTQEIIINDDTQASDDDDNT